MNALDATICFYCADQNPHRDRSRGITAYSESLMRSLLGHEVSIEAVVSQSSFAVPTGVRRLELPFRTDNGAGRLLSDHFHPLVPFRGRHGERRLWHYPKGFLPLAWQTAGPRVGTIADTILPYYFEKYPSSRHRLAFAYWMRVLKHSVEKLDLILTVSEFSARSIADFAQKHRLRCPPIINTYEGVEGPLSVPTPSAKQDYVLHLASKLPHKGTVWLLQRWRQLQQTGRTMPPLLLIGETDADGCNLAASLKEVILRAPLPRNELEKAIAAARALILPSEIEGFGLPAVEAYLCGTPAAYVRDTAVQEVLGHGTLGGFEMQEAPDSLQQALAEVFSMTAERIATKASELRQRYSWELCTENTIAAYCSVL